MTPFTREQGWTAILGAWQTHKLPAPRNIAIYDKWATADFDTLDDLTAWATALNGTVDFTRIETGSGSPYSRAEVRLGAVSLTLNAHEDASVLNVVPPELDSALSSVVATLTEPAVAS